MYEYHTDEDVAKGSVVVVVGVGVNVGRLFTTYEFGEGDKEQCEYFYFCEITGGELGTGSGPEFQENIYYEGTYALKWVPLKDFSLKKQDETVALIRFSNAGNHKALCPP